MDTSRFVAACLVGDLGLVRVRPRSLLIIPFIVLHLGEEMVRSVESYMQGGRVEVVGVHARKREVLMSAGWLENGRGCQYSQFKLYGPPGAAQIYAAGRRVPLGCDIFLEGRTLFVPY